MMPINAVYVGSSIGAILVNGQR